jgi:putative tricarboxylic transport membrane protein
MTNRIIAVCVILFAALYLYATFQIPSLEVGDPLGSKAFPMVLGIGLVLAALFLFGEKTHARGQVHDAEQDQRDGRKSLFVVGVVACWTLIFFMLFESLGFLLSSLPYFFVLMVYFNHKKWLINAIVSVVFSVAAYTLFAKVLDVALPKGLLYF